MIKHQDIDLVNSYIKSNWINTVRNITEDSGTLLGLPYPYTVPCMKTEEMQNYFYWDTYFTNVGLIIHRMKDFAKDNADNLIYDLDKYGYIPNGNRTFFLSRSQPPYLSLMIRDIYKIFNDKGWLRLAYDSLKKEYEFWMNKRITEIGLNQHFHHASDEELIQFYDDELEYRINFHPENREEKLKISTHYLAEGETGWDFTPRFDRQGADFIQIDLNALLYIYEMNFVYFSEQLKLDEIIFWNEKASLRKELYNKYLWNAEKGIYCDYNFKANYHSKTGSLAAFLPLWAGIASKEQAQATVDNLNLFEYEYGVSVCEKSNQEITYQWDYPNGWPPMFYITINGLHKYGYTKEAKRIAEKYLQVVIKNFESTGDLWEKYNVVDGSINVNNEYEMPAMMGWTAGVFAFCAEFIKKQF